MTTLDSDLIKAFNAAYVRIANVFGSETKEEQMLEYFKALSDIPSDMFDAMATKLERTCEFFPKPVQWRQAADAVAEERRQEALRFAEDESSETFACLVCLDSGFEELTCRPGALCKRCASSKMHPYDHQYARKCSCRDSNPVWQERQARRVKKFSEPREGGRK